MNQTWKAETQKKNDKDARNKIKSKDGTVLLSGIWEEHHNDDTSHSKFLENCYNLVSRPSVLRQYICTTRHPQNSVANKGSTENSSGGKEEDDCQVENSAYIEPSNP